jgi:hypothetical protein
VGRGHGHERLAGAHFGDDCDFNNKMAAISIIKWPQLERLPLVALASSNTSLGQFDGAK